MKYQFKANHTLILLAGALLSLTGCATLAVDQYIHHPRSSFVDEFTTTVRELAGRNSRLEKIDGHDFARIVVMPASNDCKERPVMALLLPMEKDADIEAMLRLDKPPQPEALEDNQREDQSVRIFFYVSADENEKNIDQSLRSMLADKDWRGYPSVVVVGYKKGGLYIDKLAYRISPEADGVVVRPFNCNGYCHRNWKCKNRENNVAGIILKPLAVIFDVITAPIQLLATVVILCIHDGP